MRRLVAASPKWEIFFFLRLKGRDKKKAFPITTSSGLHRGTVCLLRCLEDCPLFENPEVAFGSSSELLRLIDLIYSAVGKPDLWPVVLDGIADAVQGESTAMFARFPKDSVMALTRFEPGSFEEFAEYYSNVNPLMPRCDDKFPDGEVRYSHHVMENREFENTEFYADFFRRYDMHYSFGIKIPLEGHPAAYISCQRPKAKGPFDDREGLVYQTLLPHLQRALRLHFQFSQMEARALGLETALDAFGHAVLGLNGEGRVVLANSRAETMAHYGDGIKLVNGRPATAFPDQNQRLQALISDAVAGEGGFASGGSMLVERESGKKPLRVTVSPFRGTLPGGRIRVAVLIFVGVPETNVTTRAAAMRALYGLTPAEARIADLLVEGLEIRETAIRLGTTVETARFHVKRVLAKTGCRRQSELIRLMLSIPNIS